MAETSNSLECMSAFPRPRSPPSLFLRYIVTALTSISQVSHKQLLAGSCCSFGKLAKGVGAIVEEIDTRGTDTDKECLNYVLRQRAGSSPLLFSNSAFPRDTDANGLRGDRKSASGEGMNLDDFVAHRDAQKGGLAHAHVLALRLYSTAAFRSLNECAAPAFSCLLNTAPA